MDIALQFHFLLMVLSQETYEKIRIGGNFVVILTELSNKELSKECQSRFNI